VVPEVLDPAALALSAAPHARARTLPAAAYHSAEVFAWEQTVLFAGSWLCAGRSDELTAGDRRALMAGDQPIILTRTADGTLHCLSNVCRHRGHEVVPAGRSSDRVLRCPYHGWVYGLDGAFRGGPRLRETPGVRSHRPGAFAGGVARRRVGRVRVRERDRAAAAGGRVVRRSR